MADLVTSILAFIVAIGVLVTVHEFGHYWVARRCGVRVLRFSVGFGQALWKRRFGRDRTEWVIAALPLGGYVKMLDEREDEVDASERHRAFNNQPLPQRASIVAAGPIINVLLAVLAYWAMFMIGVQGVAPIVGSTEPESPAAVAGFERGDRIVAVMGEDTPSWSEVRLALLDSGLGGGGTVPVAVEREDGGPVTRRLDLATVSLKEEAADPVRTLGFEPWMPQLSAEIREVVPDSPAARAGLQDGDRIVSAAGQQIADWQQWAQIIRDRPGETFPITVRRAGSDHELQITPESVEAGGKTVGRAGVYAPQPSAQQRDRMLTTVRYGPVEALTQGAAKTWDIAALTVRVLGGLVTGQAAVSNLSGPISIAQFAGQSAQIGLASFVGFIALISVSIGLLNLLPIPVLDGGHLLYYAIEAIKGSPVSERTQVMGQQIGIALLFAIMALAIYNDLLRLVQ